MSSQLMLRHSRFLGVDVFWALCMAFNVYLALFQGWTAQRMRDQEWKYFVACYGLVSCSCTSPCFFLARGDLETQCLGLHHFGGLADLTQGRIR